MRINKLFLIISFFVFSCFSLFAFESTDCFFSQLSESQSAALYEGEVLEAYTVDGESPGAILPEYSLIKEIALEVENADNSFSQSLVTFIPYNDSLANCTDEEKLLKIFNVAQSISTIKGTTYQSHKSGYQDEVLFSDSFLISDPKNKKSKIEDSVSESLIETKELFAYLKDSRFGGNVYSLKYRITSNEVFLEINNVNAMKYMGFKCVSAGKLHLYVDAVLTEEGVIVSGLAFADNQKPHVNVLFTTVHLPSAFLKRVDSLKNWFCSKINQL